MPPKKKRAVANAFTRTNNPRLHPPSRPEADVAEPEPSSTSPPSNRLRRRPPQPLARASGIDCNSEDEEDVLEKEAEENHGRLVQGDWLEDDSEIEETEEELVQLHLTLEDGLLVQRSATDAELEALTPLETKTRGSYYNKALPETASRQTLRRRELERKTLEKKYQGNLNKPQPLRQPTLSFAVAVADRSPPIVTRCAPSPSLPPLPPPAPSSPLETTSSSRSATPSGPDLTRSQSPDESPHHGKYNAAAEEEASDAADADYTDEAEAVRIQREEALDQLLLADDDAAAPIDLLSWEDTRKLANEQYVVAFKGGLKRGAEMLRWVHDFANLILKGSRHVAASESIAKASHEGRGNYLAKRASCFRPHLSF
ncbi:hypothetical protein JCM11641_003198 [Rhodosporidiobolus odoratus]